MDPWHKTTHGNPENPTVVLLHGFLGAATEWNDVARPLSDRFHIVCWDLPGHGNTPAPNQKFSLPEFAEAFLGQLDAAKISECVLGGYSMGARLALYLALYAPSRFRGLILESASPGLRTQAEQRQRKQRDDALAERLDSLPNNPESIHEFLMEWYAQPLFDSLAQRPAQRAALLHARARQNPAGLAWALRSLGVGVQPNLWPKLPNLPHPVLIVAGALDEKFLALAHAMTAQIPQGRAHIHPGCGHNVHWEDPPGYTVLLQDFLDQLRHDMPGVSG